MSSHNHSLTSSKICCPQHILDISRALKKQNRIGERYGILRKYLDTHTPGQILLSLKDNADLKHKFLKICNDEICNLIIAGISTYLLT